MLNNNQGSDEQLKISVTGVFPSFTRYWILFINLSNLIVLRILEYERLDKHNFSGKILDSGGGENSRYRSLINKWTHDCVYESANTDKEINPTYIIDGSTPLPLSDGQYKHVLSLNTLEYIYDVHFVLKEMHRVLQVGGELVISVLFIFCEHGHPNNYLRRTASWWSRNFTKLDLNL